MLKRLMIAVSAVSAAAVLSGCCCCGCCKPCCCKKAKPHPQQSPGAFFVEAVEVDGGGCHTNGGKMQKNAPAQNK